jgi:hypothetical protein
LTFPFLPTKFPFEDQVIGVTTEEEAGLNVFGPLGKKGANPLNCPLLMELRAGAAKKRMMEE